AFIISKNIWKPIPSMNLPRVYHTSMVINNTLYVIGGNNRHYYNNIERINLSQHLHGQWEIIEIKNNDVFIPRNKLSYLVINFERILIFGGQPNPKAVFYDLY